MQHNDVSGREICGRDYVEGNDDKNVRGCSDRSSWCGG